jgi:ribose transport system ATP-binding protein
MTGAGRPAVPASDVPAPAPALEIRNISKSFGSNKALDQVSLTVGKGEIVGLLGQNGSGKSTLVGILAGYHLPQRGGEVVIDGKVADLPVVRSDHGLSFVFQDLGLAGDMSVLENLRMWRWSDPKAGRWLINWRSEARQAAEILDYYGVRLALRRRVATISLLDQAMLAIVRSADELRRFSAENVTSGGILVLDEPTVFLPNKEKQFLFDLIRRVADDGASVILVSHDLAAVRDVTSRVIVLRDGRLAGEATVADSTDEDLAGLVLGRAVSLHARPAAANPVTAAAGEAAAGEPGGGTDPASLEPAAPEVLRVRDLVGGRVTGIDLGVARGEILGLAGLVGSGAQDVPYLLLGAIRGASGTLAVGGKQADIAALNPTSAIGMGIAVVPADRKSEGLIDVFAIWENAQFLMLASLFSKGLLRRGRAVRQARDQVERFGVRPPDPRLPVAALSGGNAQKVLLAKWLEKGPPVLVLHEPTQGVDLGARAEIVQVVRERAARGAAVLWVTTDIEEIAAVSDRVLVMAGGQITDEIVGADVTKEAIDSAMLRPPPRAAAAGGPVGPGGEPGAAGEPAGARDVVATINGTGERHRS